MHAWYINTQEHQTGSTRRAPKAAQNINTPQSPAVVSVQNEARNVYLIIVGINLAPMKLKEWDHFSNHSNIPYL